MKRIKATKFLIEAELYEYPYNIKDLAERHHEERQNIIDSSGSMDQSLIRGSDTSDPTANKAMKLMTVDKLSSRAYREMERRTEAITETLEEFSSDETTVEIINQLYFIRHKTLDGVARHLNISRATLFRKRDTFIREISKKLGWNF